MGRLAYLSYILVVVLFDTLKCIGKYTSPMDPMFFFWALLNKTSHGNVASKHLVNKNAVFSKPVSTVQIFNKSTESVEQMAFFPTNFYHFFGSTFGLSEGTWAQRCHRNAQVFCIQLLVETMESCFGNAIPVAS